MKGIVMTKTPVRPSFDRAALLQKDRLRIDEAAWLLGCHPDTIRRYVDQDKLRAKRLPGGERRVLTESIKPYL